MNKAEVIAQIRQAFAANEYPGDAYIQGSFEGCEPFEEVGPFAAHRDWRTLEVGFLDGHYCALSFFSEAGFRFYLPAYLIADLEGKLFTADPLAHLVGSFHDASVEVPAAVGTRTRKIGGSVLLNPLRYGAITFGDYARYRLSVFTREEAAAIVSYLHYKRATDVHGIETAAIDDALRLFWIQRAAQAPPSASLRQHLADERDLIAEISKGR